MPFPSATFAKTACFVLIIAVCSPSQVEAGLPLQLLGNFSSTVVAQDGVANSYQTDLWNMEFQERAKQKKKLEQFADDANAEPGISADVAGIGVGQKNSQDVENEWGNIPGQVFLLDITEETPFAEWQVDRSAADNSRHFTGGPTAWMMSRVNAGGTSFGESPPTKNGPSFLTLLVAVIACMVMAGALFAERE
ncbi:MAG: hypothetical protein ABJZ55_21320 [Fuerstiella sp.]